jgi:hypothetical protein
MAKTSKHLDNDAKATKVSGEKKSGLMDGIVSGLPRRVNPVIVDGIVRGCSRNANPGLGTNTSKVVGSATPASKGAFGSGAFPEGKM